jgi:hypothetical protein
MLKMHALSILTNFTWAAALTISGGMVRYPAKKILIYARIISPGIYFNDQE